MARILKLPSELANQIAAGEVVERPASVIKELVENSLDAGADKIEIETELGGRRLMKVADNGYGIAREDAALALTRHATSKLTSLEDLETVTTLGFRGEALASIASVSKLTLLSKQDQDKEAVLVSKEGEQDPETTIGARATGTTIEIKDLFFNTPARRKFLRSQPTENFHIASIISHYALANPGISFTLTNNGREKIRVSKARSLKERAYQLFGKDLIESLVPLTGRESGFVKVSGYVSAPRERRTSRDSQYLFINGRFVKDRVISSGISEGFRAVLPHGVYPVAFLFLEMPPEEVDVNVHPSKTEVRFRRAEAVKGEIALSIKHALAGAGIGNKQPTEQPPGRSFDEVATNTLAIETPDTGSEVTVPFEFPLETESPSFSAASFAEPVEDSFPDNTPSLHSGGVADLEVPSDEPPPNYAVLPPVDSASGIPQEVPLATLDRSSIRPVGQLHRSFIIATDEQGLLLIDQHVAHERILFDLFRSKEYKRKAPPQQLLIPETIDLSPAQFEAFELINTLVAEFGFEISLMSGRTIAVKTVPADLSPADASNLVKELINTIDPAKVSHAADNMRDDIAATLACKAAVKINMDLTQEKMVWMVDRLLLTNSPSTCPHGRPVVLRLTMKDIERRFHRT